DPPRSLVRRHHRQQDVDAYQHGKCAGDAGGNVKYRFSICHVACLACAGIKTAGIFGSQGLKAGRLACKHHRAIPAGPLPWHERCSFTAKLRVARLAVYRNETVRPPSRRTVWAISGAGISQMRETVSQALFAYWNELRGD